MTTVSRPVVGLLAAAVLVITLNAPHAAPGAEQSVSGAVTQVTLYREQAMVTRTIPVEGPGGGVEIVVGDLPEEVVPGSLFAEGSEGVEVRAVRFRTRAVGQEPRDEVRKLDEAIEGVNEKIESNRNGQELLAKQAGYLDKLEGFVAPTATVELSKGVLDAEALEKITLFSFDQRKTIADELATLEKDAKELQKELSLLERSRAELTGGASRTVREAALFIQKQADGKASVRLSYLVSNCGWVPAYTFRAGPDRKDVRVECNGLVHQMTGEDWQDVELTLSTASPALSASGPGLAPFPVTLIQDPQQEKLSPKELAGQLEAIRQRRDAAVAESQSAATLGETIGSSWAVNSAANEFQILELKSGKDLVSSLQSTEEESTEGPSLTYPIEGPVSVASRSDQQMVRIFQTSFEGRFYHVATPVLTNHVYRETELTNTGDEDLLAGPISVYLDGRFVGRGEMPTVARGQMLVPGFGVDPQLRARRELVEKTETVRGGNVELGFKYRLTVGNYKDEALTVRIYDRLPHCEDSKDVRLTLGEMTDPLDDDALYLRRERPKGILRWEIEVPAGAIREKARTIEYAFSVEFDRTYALSTTAGADKQQEREFERLQRLRIAPAAPIEMPPPEPAPAP